MRNDVPVRTFSHRPRYPTINRLSGGCQAQIRRIDRTRYWAEATAEAFWHWATLAHSPLRSLANSFTVTPCGIPECGCDPAFFRDHLEEVLHALPLKSARELRGLVRDLDVKILDRAEVIRADSLDTPWWRDQL